MKKYDLNGAESGEFSYSEGALIAAVSGKIIPRGSVGLGIKTIYQKSESKNVMAYAADAGMICEFYENFRAGLSVENIGTKIKLEEESFSIPSGIKLALAYIPLKYGFITAQIKKYSDENITFSAGSEYGFDISANEAGFLRAGYAFGANKNLASGINFGLGLSLDDFLIDYAFSPMGDFGSSHRVSLRIVFGKKDYKIQKEEEYRPKKKSRKKKEKEDDFFIW